MVIWIQFLDLKFKRPTNALFQTVSQRPYGMLTHIWDLKQVCSTRGSS